MFSLISLYFSYRRDVVQAERFVAGLDKSTAPAPVAASGAVPVTMMEYARAA